jgi:RNA polymerase sigma factor (sigma-70 family)
VEDPDLDVVLRVITQDDRHAFGELVKHHQSGVRNLLRRLTKGDEARADDLAQVTFIKAYRNIRAFRGGAKFSTWLYRIAQNTFLDDLRKTKDHVSFDQEFEEAHAPSETRSSDLLQDLDHAFGFLKTEQVAVFDLYYKKGMSHSEVGESLQMPLGTVKTHLARGLEILRQNLKDWNHHERTTG